MLSNITVGQYFPGNSPVHRMDPRAKILLTVALIALIFLAKGFVGYALIALFVLGVTRLSGINAKFLLKGLKPVLFIIAFTLILNLFFYQGETVLVQWGFMRITLEGVYYALYMGVRLVLLVMSTQMMTLTTSPIALTDGLESLMKPLSKLGFPSHELAMMMSIALRFIPTLLAETDKIMKAQTARGADFESGNLLRRAKAMVPLLVPLFVSAFRRADELAMAMEARCYRGGNQRTRMKMLQFSKLDGYAAMATGGLCLLVLLERLMPWA